MKSKCTGNIQTRVGISTTYNYVKEVAYVRIVAIKHWNKENAILFSEKLSTF